MSHNDLLRAARPASRVFTALDVVAILAFGIGFATAVFLSI
ncbi:hypothetical protein UAM5_00007 [Ralstonia phage UAM5]|nr:hypothetical protein UAM5_00007 [Ralstonia phage UAM5]